MPLPEKYTRGGYRGVEITATEPHRARPQSAERFSFVVVHMSHNKHRFGTTEEAKKFVDDAIAANPEWERRELRRFGIVA